MFADRSKPPTHQHAAERQQIARIDPIAEPDHHGCEEQLRDCRSKEQVTAFQRAIALDADEILRNDEGRGHDGNTACKHHHQAKADIAPPQEPRTDDRVRM
jgi:hypothetical protein